MLNRLLLPILLLSLSTLTTHAAPNPQSPISNTQYPVTFTNATYLYGNVNGAPDGEQRPYCSCSVLLEDYDRDGRTDIFVGNHLLPDVLYRNTDQDGQPHFVNVARQVGLADPLGPRAAEGAAFGDVDNDGDLDLYVLSGNDHGHDGAEEQGSRGAGERGSAHPGTSAPPHLRTPAQIADGFFLNQQAQTGQATFLPAAEQAGITVDTIPCGIAFLDLDNDGRLDIYRQGHHDQTVYLNRGDGTFSDVTAAWGVSRKFDSDAMGIAPADFDNDGDLDILIGAGPENSGESGANVLLRNEGDRFVDVAAQVGLADTDSTFSAAWGDYDNDGDLDLYLAKNGLYGASTRNSLYRNDGGAFTDVTHQAGVGDDRVSTGAVFADFNNDGWLDLFVQNSGEPGWQRDTLYLNNGDGTFRDATREVGLGEENRYGYALSVGDVNGDGFLDIYNGHMAGQLNELWLNNGNANHWLALRLVGRGAPGGSNTSAIGARVRVYAGGRWQMREIAPASPGNHVGLTVHFGLGAATEAEIVEIRWPSGIVQTLRGLAADRYHTIYEADAHPTATPTPTADGQPPTATPTPTADGQPPTATPTPTVPANACLSDANPDGRVDVGDVMATVQVLQCQVYLPLVAGQWRQPWAGRMPTVTPTPTFTSSPLLSIIPSPTPTPTATPHPGGSGA